MLLLLLLLQSLQLLLLSSHLLPQQLQLAIVCSACIGSSTLLLLGSCVRPGMTTSIRSSCTETWNRAAQ